MKNVYDILVNFKKIPYEFYEWNNTDDIIHIKKICSFKVDDFVLYDFMRHDVVIEKDFLDKIFEKTEYYYGKQIKKLDYACIIYNEDVVLALLFNKDGKVVGKSKLLFDEEKDVILNGKNISFYSINYNVIKENNYDLKFTRKESKIIFLLLKYLDKVYEEKKEDELRYLYYECYDEKEQDYNKCYFNLKKDVLNADFDIISKFKTFVKVLKK